MNTDDNRQDHPPTATTWLIRAIVAILALFLVVTIPATILKLVGRSALSKQISKLRDADEPLTYAEWEARRPTVPDEENSALILLLAKDELDALAQDEIRQTSLPILGTTKMPRWSQPWPAETLSYVPEFLHTHRNLLARLDVIQDMPSGRFDVDLTQSTFTIALPNLRYIQVAAKLESLAALGDAMEGNVTSSIDRCVTTVNIAGSLSNAPSLISVLVIVAIDRLAAQTVEHVVSTGQARSESLIMLERVMYTRELESVFRTGMRAERIHHIAMWNDVRKNGLRHYVSPLEASPSLSVWPSSMNWLLGGLVDLNFAKSLEVTYRLIDALSEPIAPISAAQTHDELVNALPAYYGPLKLIHASYDRASRIGRYHVAFSRCMRTTLAVERHRIETGAWPARLDDLVPDYMDAVPLDPFSRVPLRYKLTSDGVTVYSIGHDESDDGGDLNTPKRSRGHAPDDGFRLLNPELRRIKIADSQE